MELPKSWLEEGIDENEIVHLGGKPMYFNPKWFAWNDYLVNPMPWDYMHSFEKIGVYVDDDGYVIYVDLSKGPEFPSINRGDGLWKHEQRERLKKVRPKLNLPTEKEWTEKRIKEEKLKGSTNILGEALSPVDNTDVYGSMARSAVFPELPVSDNEEMYSGYNINLAQLAVDRYRQQQPQALYHLVIGPYPVPDFLNELSDVLAGMPWWELEVSVGSLIHSKFGEVWDLVPIRSMCFMMLSTERNPIDFIGTLQRDTIFNLEGYVNAIFQRVGIEWVKYPTSPFQLPPSLVLF